MRGPVAARSDGQENWTTKPKDPIVGFYIVQILTGLSDAAAMFLVASGLSIIFGVTRIVNFAHGSFYMLGAYIGYSMVGWIGSTGIGFWAAMLLAAVAVGLIGVVMEVLLLRRIYQAPELFQLIATFGVILIIQDLAQWTWGAEDLVGPQAPGLTGAITIMGARLPVYDLALIAASLVVLGGLWLLFQRTRWGIMVRAATQDREMVGALGVNQRWLFHVGPVPWIGAGWPRRCDPAAQGRRQPADGFQHPRHRVRNRRHRRHGVDPGRLPRGGADRRA